jgi:peptidyl-prolyl cis-trans isomerase SurA
MLKKWFLASLLAGLSGIAFSQTLFTYGKYSADAKDFIRAYNKNNVQPAGNKAKDISDYLQLYINSRLKIREAYDRGYDTLQQVSGEVNNLRLQIVDNYMSDPTVAQRLIREAFDRGQKDVHIAHIFISTPQPVNGIVDTVAAWHRVDDVLKKLSEGADFLTVAQQSSDDAFAKTNKGDIGYITVFSLPYEFENVIYSTPVGKYSMPVRSRAGYHIFKVIDQRKAFGKMRAQQILLASPPNPTDLQKKQLAARADSIYKRIMAGDDFGKLAFAFSNDFISANNNGTLPDIGVGQYDPAFEKVLWSLPKDNAVSKPFQTTHGWHILKRISLKSVVTDPDNKANQIDLQQRVSVDGRWKTSRDFIYQRVIQKGGYQKFDYSDAALWAFTDSLLNTRALGAGKDINKNTPLFRIGDSTSHAMQFVSYAQAYRFKPDGSGVRPYADVMQDFLHSVMFNYYREHLEDFNDDFRNQMTEFLEGNLFFEIMQREIWNRAQTDSAALLQLYERNKSKYTWKASVDAIIFFCSDFTTAQTVFNLVKKDPSKWKKIAETYNEKVAVDSARYEWDQVPNLTAATAQPGTVTAPMVNTNDNTATFAYILKVYPQPTQRSFSEAKGMVINDYQDWLEEKWIQELRKKYPVTIDQKVLDSISK